MLVGSGAREKEAAPRTDSSATAAPSPPSAAPCMVRQRDGETIEHCMQMFHGKGDGYSTHPEIGTSKRNLLIP